MKCPRCGTENPHGRVLCVRCGTRLRPGAAAGAAPAAPETGARLMEWVQSDLRRLLVTGVVVIAVAAAMGLLLP